VNDQEKLGRVLVVDPEEQIRRALRAILHPRGYEVVFAESGQEALVRAVDLPPDVVILELDLPDLEGLDVCRELRSWLSAPIMVLSSRTAEADKIAALDEGADDYVVKPFSAGELLARIRALLRRAATVEGPPPLISVGDLHIDLARRRVIRAGEEVHLTRTEFDILALLGRNVDCVVTQRQILQSVWGPEWVHDAQPLRVHVSHLRKKLGKGPEHRYIVTEPGVGFRLSAPGREPEAGDG
jgi:two-component system KDP operon response regulator KdpE